MRIRRAMTCGIFLLVLGTACAGCGSLRATEVGSTGTVQSTSATSGSLAYGAMTMAGQCPASATDPAVVRLRSGPAQVAVPKSFVPVAVVRCMTEERAVSGDGQWVFEFAQRATGNLDALLAALREPSRAVPSGTTAACSAVGIVSPNFALVDASGTIIRPLLPHDECGLPLLDALRVLNALHWTTVTDQKVRQVQTQAEIDTGCYPTYKDVFELPRGASPQPWSQARGTAAPRPTIVCIYKVAQTSGSVSEGQFTRGASLNSSQQTELAAALDSAGAKAASPCAASATKFAVLDGAGDYIAIELDGCHRILFPNGFIGAMPESGTAALTAAGVS